MFFHRVTEFITLLRDSSALSHSDQVFLEQLEKHFCLIPLGELASEDLVWLQSIFAQRWQLVVDTPDDYTFNPSGVNAHWILFARQLAKATGKTDLQILIPVVTNIADPILFQKHAECEELRAFYLGEDGETLHRTRGLYEFLQKKQPLSTFNDLRKYTPRPLSLRELLRIRSKQGELRFDVMGSTYINFWDYLKRGVIPGFSNSGEFPRHLLPSVIELVEVYFASRSADDKDNIFSDKLKDCSKFLQECSIRDVNCLYGQLIDKGEEGPVYLIDVLLDMLKEDTAASPTKVIALARWLALQDATLLGKCRELQPLYTELGVGDFFGIEKLASILRTMHLGSSRKVQSEIDDLLISLKAKTRIDEDIISTLSSIYRYRWSEVQATNRDYTRLQGGANASWINLAQILSGANLIPANYYRFLMPTVTRDTDPVRWVCLTDYALSHYVLSSDGRDLINLDTSAARFKVDRTFYNCNTLPPKPFTRVELDRLQYASPRFHRFNSMGGKTDPMIKYSTVMAIKNLVNKSVHPDGLMALHDYTSTQLTAADEAYIEFTIFFNALPEDERARLNAQYILFNGKFKSFSEVLTDVNKQECIAVLGQYFTQLVVEYGAKDITFRPDIETGLAVDEMRATSRENSREKIFRDFDIGPKEAKRRVLILARSLLGRKYQYLPFMGNTVSLGDSSNTVTDVAKDMFDLIKPMLLSGNMKQAPFVYSRIMAFIVKPALEDKKWSTWFARYDDTKQWLISIENGTLFQEPNAWFDPFCILEAFYAHAQTKKSFVHKVFLEEFLDELIHTYLQPGNLVLKELRTNLIFSQRIGTLEKREREFLLGLVKQPITRRMDDVGFYKLCSDYLIYRLLSICPVSTKVLRGSSSFFGRRVSHEQGSLYRQFKEPLNSVIRNADELREVVNTLITSTEKLPTIICDDRLKEKMVGYLKHTKSRIVALSAPVLSTSDNLVLLPRPAMASML